MADQDDSIKRKQLLHQAAIVALGSLAAGAAVEVPIEGDADSMIHLHISGTGTGTPRAQKTLTTRNGPTNPQPVSVVVVEAKKPPAGGYKVINKGNYSNVFYFVITTPYMHGKADDSDVADTTDPMHSGDPVYVAVAW